MLTDTKTNTIQRRTFSEVLREQEPVGFVQDLIRESYQAYFVGHEREVGEMVDNAWSLLRETAPHGKLELHAAVKKVNSEIFCKQDPTFWFNTMYRVYKTDLRPKKDFERMRKLLFGRRVLDYGSGGGYLAVLLSKNRYDVSTTDILDYRAAEAKHLPFRPMTSPTDIPYPANSFDTTIIKAVLHHIEATNLPAVLKELRKISKRLIIEEDTFGLTENIPGLEELRKEQPQLVKFMNLSPEDQLQALMLIDYFANAITQGIVDMNFPFQFKTPQQWQQTFESADMTLIETMLLGFQPGNVNKTCHVWFVVDRNDS